MKRTGNMGRFIKGVSGNPRGRAPGARSRSTELRALLQPHAPELVQKCVALALAGDTTAMRICLDRLVPPMKEAPIRVQLPPVTCAKDCATAHAAILAAAADGQIVLAEAQALASLVDAQRKALETNEVMTRMDAIEALLRDRRE